jgi:hypothetical protein
MYIFIEDNSFVKYVVVFNKIVALDRNLYIHCW